VLPLILLTAAHAACPEDIALQEPLDCFTSVDNTLDDGETYLGGVCNDTLGFYDCYLCGEPDDVLSQSGPEHVYPFYCQADGEVALAVLDQGCDLDVYALDDTCDAYDGCLAGDTTQGLADGALIIDCVAGETRYVVVEGYGYTRDSSYADYCDGASGGYVLSVDLDASDACLEDCDNGVDDDIDGDIDCADDSCGGDVACCDVDEDGYYSEAEACGGPGPADSLDADCDDGDPDAFPGGTEVWYDGVDQDCDGNDGDQDGDGYDAVEVGGEDCDDTPESGAAINPDADESCDLVDNDCDGSVDEGATDLTTYYLDDDADGYGDSAAATEACGAPVGYAAAGGDCDDTDGAVNPGADETCDTIDEDCDGAVDEDALDAVVLYADEDGDGYGDPGDAEAACEGDGDRVADSTDCDDDDPDSFPGGVEVCDRADNDCDGEVDNAVKEKRTWYLDGDDDGFGDPEQGLAICEPPDGYVAYNTDCDDGDPDVYPGGADTWYDGIDGDCEGDNDFDADRDAFVAVKYDAEAGGTAPDPGDCDDTPGTGEAIFPGAFDEWYDGVDADCAGNDDYDRDGDGYAAEGYEASGEAADCDDDDPELYPGAPGLDEDCEPLDTAPPEDTSPPEDTEPPPEDTDPPEVEDTGTEDDGKRCSTSGGSPDIPALLMGLLFLFGGRRRRDICKP